MLALSGRRLVRTLVQAAAALFALHVLLALLPFSYPGDGVLRRLVNPDAESSFVTVLSFTILALVAVAAALNASNHPDARRPWAGLTCVFALAATDEVASVHESFVVPLRAWLDVGGAFHFAWVIPGFVVVALLALVYLPFVWRLPHPTRTYVFAGTGSLVAGGLGVEMVGGWLVDTYGSRGPAYALASMVEEALEVTGGLVLLHGFLRHAAGEGARLVLHVEGPRGGDRRAPP